MKREKGFCQKRQHQNNNNIPSVIGMKQNTHMLDSQGYPSVIQEHDTEIRGRLGKLGCGNLGIWE